jgi:hypothetical protein
MIREIVLTVIVTLIVDDLARSSRWSAAKVVRWSAERIYVSDSERAARRAEEWDGLVSDSIPSDISALFVGISLGAFAVACMARRGVTGVASRCRRACRRLPGRVAPRDGRAGFLLDDHREASMALLEAALELRLCLADDVQVPLGGTAGHLPAIRRLAADAQLRAANVALLGAGTLGESARKLGEAAGRLADEVSRAGEAASGGAGVPDVSELDASIRAFQRRAAAVSRDLAGNGGAVPAESAGRSPGRGRSAGDGQR